MVRRNIRPNPFNDYTIEDYRKYFDDRGGKVKQQDPVWIPLYKFLNALNKGKKGYKLLKGQCGQCRSEAKKMIYAS